MRAAASWMAAGSTSGRSASLSFSRKACRSWLSRSACDVRFSASMSLTTVEMAVTRPAASRIGTAATWVHTSWPSSPVNSIS